MLVICNGMMRAGSTLQYNLVRCLLEELSAGESHGYFEASGLGDSAELPTWLASPQRHAVKMHALWDRPDFVREGQLKRCYVYRDIRDVAASARQKFPITWDELLVILEEAIEVHELILENSGVLTQRYETMIADPSIACAELAQYLDVEVTPAHCRLLTARCVAELTRLPNQFPHKQRLRHHFDHARVKLTKSMIALVPQSVRQQLRRLGLQQVNDAWTQTRSQADPKTLMHPDHFSPTRGQPGAWLQVFSLEEQSVLETRFADWLTRHDYPLLKQTIPVAYSPTLAKDPRPC